jgi:hypothetical protein
MSRFVRPDTRTLTLANGDQLTVKARLSAGEQRAAQARMYAPHPLGGFHRTPLAVLEGAVVAYLLDWTLRDDADRAVVIRDLSPADLQRVLDQLDPVDYDEIKSAIEAHETAMQAERDEQKKTQTGGPA